MKLIFGCGYLGSRVAARWLAAGDVVTVVTRHRKRAKELEMQGMRTVLADVTQLQSLKKLPLAETVLFAVGYDHSSGQSIHDVYTGGVRNVLDRLPEGIGRFIYVSTTGVYGTAGGNWVDENTPASPEREGGKASLAAEQMLRDHPLGRRGIILRLAGIYGPNRIAYLDKLKAGESIPAPTDGHVNLIYVDDAAESVLAAERLAMNTMNTSRPRVYCVSDGTPVTRGEYYREVARTLDSPAPTFTAPDAKSPRVARAASDKRVNNSRMLAELRVCLSCPTFREGLVKILQIGDN